MKRIKALEDRGSDRGSYGAVVNVNQQSQGQKDQQERPITLSLTLEGRQWGKQQSPSPEVPSQAVFWGDLPEQLR